MAGLTNTAYLPRRWGNSANWGSQKPQEIHICSPRSIWSKRVVHWMRTAVSSSSGFKLDVIRPAKKRRGKELLGYWWRHSSRRRANCAVGRMCEWRDLGESGEALFALGVTFIGQCDRDAALHLWSLIARTLSQSRCETFAQGTQRRGVETRPFFDALCRSASRRYYRGQRGLLGSGRSQLYQGQPSAGRESTLVNGCWCWFNGLGRLMG